MNPSLIRFFLSSGILLLAACKGYPVREGFEVVPLKNTTFENNYFQDTKADYVYKATVRFHDFQTSGLFILKKISESEHRAVLTSQMGNKIIDLMVTPDSYDVQYVQDELDRGILMNMLAKDIRQMTMKNVAVTAAYTINGMNVLAAESSNEIYYYYLEKEQLLKIHETKNGKEKTRYLFSQIHGDQTNEITIQHLNQNLIIHLKSIDL